MHPEQIKAAIRMRGTTPTAIAEELKVSRSMVSHVINGHAKSERIAKRIAEVIGDTVEAIWPANENKPALRRIRVNHPDSARAPA
ncbi:MAG: helix-turn-helix domain-containing protein [Delftia sp.]|jgi:lambda repressor-like predicted transcriptional regulator|nr:helix-turn-helix domain-containing protein [Delftia sp.]